MLQEAQLRAEKVTVSSIPPRADEHENATKEKISAINEHLNEIASSHTGVDFIDHDRNFTYRDGTSDNSLLLPGDMLHLSAEGTQKLIENLGLKDVATSSVSNRKSQKQSNKEKHSIHGTSSQTSAGSYHQYGSHQQHPQHHGPKRPWPGNKNLPHKDKKHYFRSRTHPMSNFFACQLYMWGISFKSSEHAYQWRKARFLKCDDIQGPFTP